jgi:hypothetical protein
MMGVFDQRNLDAFGDKAGNDFLDQGGLAASGIAGDGDGFHDVDVGIFI